MIEVDAHLLQTAGVGIVGVLVLMILRQILPYVGRRSNGNGAAPPPRQPSSGEMPPDWWLRKFDEINTEGVKQLLQVFDKSHTELISVQREILAEVKKFNTYQEFKRASASGD